MQLLTNILMNATGKIDYPYFHVELDGGDPVYRERVYCYELYHQMRAIWPSTTPFRLNGELDKAAHPILRGLGASYAKPDLLVHQPGHMEGNNAIIEVKSRNASAAGILKDLQTLNLFKTKVGYERAIYLIFGFDLDDTVNRINAVAQKIVNLASIELWVHAHPNQPALPGKIEYSDA